MGDRLLSALTAGVLSFGWPKESSQRKGHPRVDAPYGGSLRYSDSRAAAELALATPGLKQSSPTSLGRPALLGVFHGDPEHQTQLAARVGKTPLVSRAPWEALSNAGLDGALGEHCPKVRHRRTELRSPRPSRVAQGTRQRRAPTQGGLFFGDFLLVKQKKVTRRSAAENNASASKNA